VQTAYSYSTPAIVGEEVFSTGSAARPERGVSFCLYSRAFLLLLMVSASLCTMAATGFIYMLPVFGERVLHTTSVQLGWLWSALSLGSFVTTIWLAFKKEDGFCRRLWIIGGAAAVGGAAVFALTAAKSFVLAAVIIVVIGGSSGLVTPIVSASLQQLTPQDLLARVFSVFNTAVMALAMIGMTAVGWASDRFGPFTSLVRIGTVQPVAACSALVVLPWCRQLPDTVSKTTSAKKRTA
jgi:DHA3 family macrolide efflux protein-like MFS transporter